MSRIRQAVALIIIMTGAWGLSCANADERKLIRVTIGSPDATVVASSQPATAQPIPPRTPTPREQMYVFWILGKVLSYPVDKVESYVNDLLKKPLPGPVVKPASATPGYNPFEARSFSEIPPAPPARRGAAAPND
jgi:hypothetical protein